MDAAGAAVLGPLEGQGLDRAEEEVIDKADRGCIGPSLSETFRRQFELRRWNPECWRWTQKIAVH